MAIDTTCPHCDSAYSLADRLEGKTVRCKRCNDTFTVPSLPRTAVPSRPVRREEGIPCDEDDRDRRGRRNRRPRPRRGVPVWVWLGITGLVLLLVVGGGVTAWLLAAQPPRVPDLPGINSNPPADNAADKNFDKIRIGMTEAEVIALAGEPVRKEDLAKVWFFHNGLTDAELTRPDGSLKPVRKLTYLVHGMFEAVLLVEGRVYKKDGKPGG
jgi:predicted Zn finger-like uncharacterized protein